MNFRDSYVRERRLDFAIVGGLFFVAAVLVAIAWAR